MYQLYENQLQLDFYKSKFCYLYLVSIIVLSVLAVFIVPVDVFYKLSITAIIVLLCLHVIRKRNQVVAMKWFKENHWGIFSDRGVMHRAELLNNSFITRFICVLNFKLENGKKLSYTIFPDSIHHEQMRRFMVRMKIEHSRLFAK